MDKIYVKKRLVGRQDISWDTNGVGGSDAYVNDRGESFIVTKVNSTHIPTSTRVREVIGTNDIDSSLLQLDSKIKDITQGAYLTEDVTLTYNSVSSTISSFNAEIEGVLKNLGGHTLTLYFGDGFTLQMASPIEISGFYNGNIEIVGGQSTTLSDLNVLDGLFIIRNCLAEVEFTDFTFTHTYSTYGLAVYDSLSVGCTNCFFQGASAGELLTYCALYDSSNGYFSNCVLTQDEEVLCRSVIENHISSAMEKKFEGVINLVDNATAWGVASSLLACPTADANNLGTGAGLKQSSNYYIPDSADIANLPVWLKVEPTTDSEDHKTGEFVEEPYSGFITTLRYLAPSADGEEYVILQRVTQLDGRTATREYTGGVWGKWRSGVKVDYTAGVFIPIDEDYSVVTDGVVYCRNRGGSTTRLYVNDEEVAVVGYYDNAGHTDTITVHVSYGDTLRAEGWVGDTYFYPYIANELNGVVEND